MATLALVPWTEQHISAGADWPHTGTDYRTRIGGLDIDATKDARVALPAHSLPGA